MSAPPRQSWATSEAIRRTMVATGGRDTAPEWALRRAAHRLGLRYRVGVRPLPGVRRTGDLVFQRARVVVFLDGCFWHGCPQHFQMPVANRTYWESKIRGNMRRDADTDDALHAAGWLPIRVWEHEEPAGAAHRVAAAVAERRASARPAAPAAARSAPLSAAPPSSDLGHYPKSRIPSKGSTSRPLA